MTNESPIKEKNSYFKWLSKTFNWVFSGLIALGELSPHLQTQNLGYSILEFVVVFLLVSLIAYKFGWFWNWFTKPFFKK